MSKEVAKIHHSPGRFPKVEYKIREAPKELVAVHVPVGYKPLFEELKEEELSFLEKVWFVIKSAPKLISIIYKILKLIQVMKMNSDKKTTFIATIKVILGIVVTVLALFGLNIDNRVVEALIAIAASGYFIFSWLQGLFTNKADKPK